jgi:ABC-type lipoprotein release transport system permease subunit
MLIVEKKDDIKSLTNMGASKTMIANIFMYEGWLITFIGIIAGITIGLILCLLQQHFGFIRLSDTPGAYIIDSYPVIVKISDVLVVFSVVSLIGILTVLYPVNNLRRKLEFNR